MKSLLHSSSFILTCFILAFLAAVFLPATVKAQCPTPPNCTPGNPPAANVIFGMGIFNVNINNGAINNTSPGVTASTGYVDYSCTISTTLQAQNSYPVSVQTNPNAPENVRIWIDFDNNGIFNTTTELVFSSNSKLLHTGNISIPATAVMNLPLRLRVAADNASSPFPTPCGTSQYSQVEDYRVLITPNNSAPAPQFSADKPVTCTPTVQFQDLSQNGPISWAWNFGDPSSGAANTSTLANPSHTFSTPGLYTVTLTTCNANGCNTITKTDYINYHTNVPVAGSCTPVTASFCCGFGITNFNFGNGLITNASANGSVGYEDFTCTKSATVVAGAPYPFTLSSGSTPQDFRIYIDLNNDGAFTGAGEMVWQALNTANPSGTITIPTAATLNVPLRMRIISDYATSPFNSCGNIQNGQAEDYTLIVTPSINKPVANFRTDSTTTCSGVVPFLDISTLGATSWHWNFGDPASGAANTSTLQNPTHTYTAEANATYTVTLVACNSSGCDTITKTNYINFSGYCRAYCPSSAHINTNRWISNVSFGSINNTTGQEPGGYGNYTHVVTDMPIGSVNNPLTVTITTPLAGPVNVWIDFNKDGVFQLSEKVISKGVNVQSSIKTVTENISIPPNVTPGLTRMRVLLSFQLQNDACVMGNADGEAEDYYINFIPNTLPITTRFTANQDSICTGAVKFTDNSLNMPTSWLWNFGDGNTSTAQNPSHAYSKTTPGIYTVTLISCKAGQCDTMTVSNLISMTVPCSTYCAVSGTTGTTRITNVQVGSINNSTTTISPNGYGNFTHLSTDLIIGSNKNPVSITSVQAYNDLQIWIDVNHDRIFQPNERLLYRSNPTSTYLDSIDIPGAAIPGPTRMRIAIGYSSSVNNPCAAPGFNEVEDYTVVLKHNQSLPVINFTGTPLITCNGQATFQATTTNSLNTYTWNFGDPASGAANNTSTLSNPSHTFSSPGLYTITLTACNSVGCTTITKTNYINYEPSNIACRSVNMPGSNTPLVTTHCSGLLFDRGGPNGPYFAGGTSVFVVIDPPGAGSVSLTFTAFDLAPGDRIYIHDGRSFNDPVLAMYTGISLPNNGQPIVSSYGPLTVRHYMTGSGIDAPGFAATWSCTPAAAAPVPNFRYNPESINCDNRLEFFDRSTNGATSWFWDFGNPGSGISNRSTLPNPKHSFSQTGFYTVTLTACNSIGCDTISKQIYLGYVGSNTAPRPANCRPPSYYRTCCGYGISRFSLNNVNHTSSLSAFVNSYENFSCQIKDTVQAGSTYPLTVVNNLTGANENVKVWIDYNNNGDFDTNELVLNSLNKTTHTAQIIIPIAAVRNIPLLVRVISDKATNTITNGCYEPQEGQIKDYAVYIVTTLSATQPMPDEPLRVEVFPNPTTGKVNLKLNHFAPDNYQIEVTNMLGQQLQQKTVLLSNDGDFQLDLSGYSKGVYYIRLSNSQTSVVRKIIVE